MKPEEVLADIDAHRRPRPHLETPLVQPADLVEAALAELWAEVLGVAEVGALDNFFALGGDSLHMTQVASRLRAQFGLEVSFTRFFEQPTIAGVAGLIRESIAIPDSQSARVHTVEVSSEAFPESPDKECEIRRLAWEGPPLAIASLLVPTRNRPAALIRCLRGYMSNLRRYGHACRVIVVDDSRDDAASSSVAEAVAALGREFGILTDYCGPVERSRLAGRLTKAGLEQDVVAFAINGWRNPDVGTSGATRNVLALLAAGDAYVSVDDDTECRFATAENFAPAAASHNGQLDPSDLRAFPDRAALLSSVSLRNLDFIQAHQQLLGRDCTPGRVLITLAGVAGDCGWGSPSRYFSYLDDRALERLAHSKSDWNRTLTSRETLRMSRSYYVTDRADLLMTTAFGADNRALLPPFAPVGRGSDMLFGSMLPAIQPDARFGYLPWAVLHSPSETRQFWPGEHARSAGTIDIATMLRALVPGPVAGLGGAGALASSGRALGNLARHSRTEFVSIVKERVGRLVEAELVSLEQRADDVAGSLPHWSEDAREYVRGARSGLGGRHAGIPVEFLYGRELDDAAELARKLVGEFGKLLAIWPELTACARQLN